MKTTEQKAKAYDKAFEKAKRYDNIIEKANKMHHENCEACQMCIEELIPELAESEDERIRNSLVEYFESHHNDTDFCGSKVIDILAWLEKQGEQKAAKSESFEIEHGKYYYCIQDYYSGGNKRASKGDVVQALRGMSMMALDDKVSEYFLPVNSIEQKPVEWSEEDKEMLDSIILDCSYCGDFPDYPTKEESELYDECLKKIDWLKSLKDRYTWKPSEEQLEAVRLGAEVGTADNSWAMRKLQELYEQLKALTL